MIKDKTFKEPYRFVLGSQYFLYFGVLGIFLPYFNLYCYHLGFSGFQIGGLSALRTSSTVLFSLIWGVMADRFQIRRPIYILCNFLSTGIWIFFLYTSDFWVMFVITLFYGIFYAPIISFLEAFTMDILGKEKRSYGRIRAWGSINFILAVILIGAIIDYYPIKIILVIILIGSLLQALSSTAIPHISITGKNSFAPITKVLLKKRAVVFLFCNFLMLLSHGTYYGFFSIHLENLGFGNTFIGIVWAIATIAEILVMIRSEIIFRRFSLENVLVFSFMIAALRWFVLFFAVSPVSIVLSQIFHALTYGTFHMASILYMDKITPDEAKTLGQVVNNAVSYGLGMMVGFFLNGYFYETIGTRTLFMISCFIALFGGIMLRTFQKIERGKNVGLYA
jgi:PPP family 3-phenylpropionic acid transporter